MISMEIDLHGFYLWDAIEEITYTLDICKINGEKELSIIHGYRRGNVIKNYLQSEGFLVKMKREGFILKRKKNSNPGVSTFIVC